MKGWIGVRGERSEIPLKYLQSVEFITAVSHNDRLNLFKVGDSKENESFWKRKETDKTLTLIVIHCKYNTVILNS